MNKPTYQELVEELSWCGPFLLAMKTWFDQGLPFTAKMRDDLNARLEKIDDLHMRATEQ